jgi:drug/metabolite transporter (DMT)-like permease
MLLWSGNFLVGRALRDAIDPAPLTLLRWSLALLVLLPWVGPRAWRARAALRREWRWLAALGLTGLAGFHTLCYVALQGTTAVNAMLILALAPAATLLAGAYSGGTRPGRLQWAGTGVSMAGAAWLIAGGGPGLAGGLSVARGDAVMLLAVALWVGYSLLLRRRPADLPHDVVLAGSIVPALVALLPLAAWSIVSAGGTAIVATPRVLGLLAYVVLGASVLAFLLWSWGVGRLGPERAAPYVHLLPLFGALLSGPVLGEWLEPAQVVGGALVLAGLAWTHRDPRPTKAGRAAPHRDR